MSHKKSSHGKRAWQVDVRIDESQDRAHAVAEMHYRGQTLVGVGRTRLDAGDQFPDRVGEELAIARALSDLTRQLFAATASDIEAVTGEEVSVR